MQTQECEEGIGWAEMQVPSSDPKKEAYTVVLAPWGEGFCNCPGFEYRGDCRHLRYALDRRCNWKSELTPKQTDAECREHICPVCGGPTRTVVYIDDPTDD